jgi:hypothetical protein
MRRGTLALSAVLVMAVVFAMRSRIKPAGSDPGPISSATGERSPLCPWREPQRDLSVLFPGATNYFIETRILSGMMVPIQKRLGRAMTVDENPLRIFRAQSGRKMVGSILVCRVKGEHGGMELVAGVETNGAVRGVLIQSQREPETVARAITNAVWLASFAGKNSDSPLRAGEDLPDVPPAARASAQALADGVRSQLIVLSFAETLLTPREPGTHTNY